MMLTPIEKKNIGFRPILGNQNSLVVSAQVSGYILMPSYHRTWQTIQFWECHLHTETLSIRHFILFILPTCQPWLQVQQYLLRSLQQ